MVKPTVIKIGGATLGSHDTALADIVELQKRGIPLVIVHGGAKVVTRWLERQRISTRFIDGERVTDESALEMVTAVLGGLVNKEIVAAINDLGGRAVGISGIDGALIQSRIRDREMGYTGDVVKVNTGILDTLLGSSFLPVISPISSHILERPENTPAMLNINGDTVAGEIAAATSAERLIFLTDVGGINDHSGRHIPNMVASEAEELLASGVASGGMVPKIKACLKAISNDFTTCVIMDGRKEHNLVKEFDGTGSGTQIAG